MEEYIYPSDSTPEYRSILVPNVDNVRTDFLIQTIAMQGKVRLTALCTESLGEQIFMTRVIGWVSPDRVASAKQSKVEY